MSRKFSLVALALAAGLIGGACTDQPLTSPDALSVSPNFDANPVTDRVSAGSNDACAAFGLPNGCDKNFSLHANMKADGSVTGQYQDGFPGGGEGIHADVQCVNIVGNGAVVGGVITNGQIGGVDVSGQSVFTAVIDNGTSANDPPDQIGFSINADPVNFPPSFCINLDPFNFPFGVFDLNTGQVTVK